MSNPDAAVLADESPAARGIGAMLSELFKARLSALVLLTTGIGFHLATRGAFNGWLFFHTLAGTALVAAGASALNQYLEREYDSLMTRTAQRPIPSGRLQPLHALLLGGLVAIGGLVHLSIFVNILTAFLGALTFCAYLFIYTPLKRITPLNTVIGAIPGAIPPIMGWTAARNELNAEGWSLFAILFFWQLPHFLAIAWLYREDYARGGFAMLPVVEPDGVRTGRHAVCHTLGLIAISLFPFVFRLVGSFYLVGAVVLGFVFLASALRFARALNALTARRLFLVSILYLPVLLGLMVFDKVR